MTNHEIPSPTAVWVDGDPLMEAIAAAVWEQCGRSDSGSCVEDDPRTIAAVAAAVSVPPSAPRADDQAALRDRIAEALLRWAERGNDPQYASMRRPETVRANAYSRADAVLAVLPAPVDRAAVLREAADALPEADLPFVPPMDRRRVADWLRRMADEAAVPGPCVAGEQQQNETPEDPARIDRLRPEFTEHSSVEAIDAQLRRSRAQERRWHIRTEWLISLRADRVAQKERGEWPAAGVRQDGTQP